MNWRLSFFFVLNIVPRSSIDDEYANATVSDPKILLITSRDPSAPLAQFVKVVPSLFWACICSMGWWLALIDVTLFL